MVRVFSIWETDAPIQSMETIAVLLEDSMTKLFSQIEEDKTLQRKEQEAREKAQGKEAT